MMLEVGMKLYSMDARTILTITRVTRCLAMAKRADGDDVEFTFYRDIVERQIIYERGAHGWDKTAYVLETPEIKAKRHRLVLEHRYSKINVSELRTGQLEKILKIAEEPKEGGEG